MKTLSLRPLSFLTALLASALATACSAPPAPSGTDEAAEAPADETSALSEALVGATCGTLLGLQCAAGEFCAFPSGARCGIADQGGKCQARPLACPLIHLPVCGCDGRTYTNRCVAARSGVSVARGGACEPTQACPAGQRECRMCGTSPIVTGPERLPPMPICQVRCVPVNVPCPPIP